VSRLEPILVALCLASWAATLLHLTGVVSLAGDLHLSLYAFYSLAAAGGWLTGNVYVRRRAGLPKGLARRLLVVYLFGPPGLLFLLRAMSPLPEQVAAPMVSIYAGAVYSVFFFVPVTFGRSPAVRSGPGVKGDGR
jgi:hypothetical protein